MPRIVPFEPAHVPAAAGLVSARAQEARRREPLLPDALEEPSAVVELLGPIADQGLGVVAVEGDGVVGFLAGLGVDLWGGSGVYVPEWAHAVGDPGLIRTLHAGVSPRWVAAGRTVHAVTLWADDAGEAAWHDLGFGLVVIDTIRDLAPVPAPTELPVRLATPRDAGTVSAFERALWEHLAGPPTCRIHPEPDGVAAVAARLGDGGRPVWLAGEGEGGEVGYLSVEPHGVYPTALAGRGVLRCDGAFVLPGARRAGAGRALLAEALAWGTGAGFTRLAVDHESANTEASRFWPAVGCRPVLRSVGRRVA